MLQFQWGLANLPAKTFWINVLGKIYSHTIHNSSLKSKADSHIPFVHPDPDVYGQLQRANICSVILSKVKSPKQVPCFFAHSASVFFISGHSYHFSCSLKNSNCQGHFPFIFWALSSEFSELCQLSDAFQVTVLFTWMNIFLCHSDHVSGQGRWEEKRASFTIPDGVVGPCFWALSAWELKAVRALRGTIQQNSTMALFLLLRCCRRSHDL